MNTHLHFRSFPRTTALILAGSIAAFLIPATESRAASGTWLDTGVTDGFWFTTTNWLSGAVPGASTGTTNADTATFNTPVGTFGTSGSPVLIDANRNLKGISFDTAAGNYALGTTGGDPLLLSSLGTIQILNTLTATNAIETINAPLVIEGGFTFANNSANGSGAGAGTLNFGGGITGATGATTLTLNGSNTNANTISGIIGNGTATSVAIYKIGTGTWVLSGANSFSGNLQVGDGTLSINSIANTGVASPLGVSFQINLGVASGIGSIGSPKLQFTGVGGGSSNRTINLIPNGLNGGGIIENTVAGQTLTLSGTVISNSTLSTNVSLGLTGAGDGVLSGTVSNAFGRVSLSKSGTGTWTFSGANTYSGDTTVSGGTLKVGNTKALGFGGVQTTATGATTVNSGFTLDLNGTTGINEPITINGAGIGGNGALVNNSGTPASIANGIAGLAVPATGIGSGLSSAPSVVISGTGSGATATASLGLTSASFTSISGGTGWVTGDTVQITGGPGSGAIGTVTASGGAITGITVINAGRGYSAPTSVFRLTGTGSGTVTVTGNATNFTVGGLAMTNAGSNYTGTPTVTIGGPAAPLVAPALSSVNLATDSSIGGSGDTTINSVISGAGMTKVGAGTLTLTGANTYTGNTTVHAGTLKLDLSGSISGSPNIVVGDAGSTGTHLDVTSKTGGLILGAGQTLRGIGQIDGNTTIFGTHAPGNSPGLQTFNGTLIYSTGSLVNLELAANQSTDTTGFRGFDFDAMDVIGAGVLSIATGVTSNLTFNAPGSVVDWGNPFWTSNHTWLVYDDANAPTLASAPIFDTLTVTTDSLGATLNGGTFSWGQTGNDVVLQYSAATPEPGTVGLLLAGLPLLGLRRGR